MKVIGKGIEGKYLSLVTKEEIRQILMASGMSDSASNEAVRDDNKIIGREYQIEGMVRVIDDVVDLQKNYYFKELKAKLDEMVKMFDAFTNTAVAFNEQAKMIDKSRRRKK